MCGTNGRYLPYTFPAVSRRYYTIRVVSFPKNLPALAPYRYSLTNCFSSTLSPFISFTLYTPLANDDIFTCIGLDETFGCNTFNKVPDEDVIARLIDLLYCNPFV